MKLDMAPKHQAIERRGQVATSASTLCHAALTLLLGDMSYMTYHVPHESKRQALGLGPWSDKDTAIVSRRQVRRWAPAPATTAWREYRIAGISANVRDRSKVL